MKPTSGVRKLGASAPLGIQGSWEPVLPVDTKKLGASAPLGMQGRRQFREYLICFKMASLFSAFHYTDYH